MSRHEHCRANQKTATAGNETAREFNHAVADDKSGEVITEACAIGEREDSACVKAKVGGPKKGPDTEQRSEREFIRRNANVVSENGGGLDLVGLVNLLPPTNPGFDPVAHSRADGCQLREIRIAPRSEKTERSEKKKDHSRSRGVTPSATERLRKIARKEIPNAPPSLGVGAINTAMGANHQAIEIIDQPRVAGFGPSNCEIRSRAAIDAPQLAHLVALQATQCHLIETLKKFLESLPDGLAFIDEAIQRHGFDFGLRISDCEFRILDFGF